MTSIEASGGPGTAPADHPNPPGSAEHPDATDPCAGLSELACGVVLVVAQLAERGAGEPGTDIATLVAGGADAEACRAALSALAARPRSERARTLALLAGRLGGAVPSGIGQVHPGWLRAALEGEATEILLAVTEGLAPEVQTVAREIVEGRGEREVRWGARVTGPEPDADADADADTSGARRPTWDELRRAIFSRLVAIPDATQAARPGAPAWQRLAALPIAALLAHIARGGAEVLGVSLAGAPAAVIARAAAQTGDRALADAVLESARRSPLEADRDRARSLVVLAAVISKASGVAPTEVLGLAALAQRLASEPGEAVRAIAQRLPIVLGQILLDQHLCALEARFP